MQSYRRVEKARGMGLSAPRETAVTGKHTGGAVALSQVLVMGVVPVSVLLAAVTAQDVAMATASSVMLTRCDWNVLARSNGVNTQRRIFLQMSLFSAVNFFSGRIALGLDNVTACRF